MGGVPSILMENKKPNASARPMGGLLQHRSWHPVYVQPLHLLSAFLKQAAVSYFRISPGGDGEAVTNKGEGQPPLLCRLVY